MRFRGIEVDEAVFEAVSRDLGLVPIMDFGCPMYEQHLWDPADPKPLIVRPCWTCQAKYAEWVVRDSDWLRLPKNLRKHTLCADCFAKAVGLSPGRTARERFEVGALAEKGTPT